MRLHVLLALAVASRAGDFERKTDNLVIALELQTGREIWCMKPDQLSDARFELYPDGLVVFPTAYSEARDGAFALALASGSLLPAFEPKGACVGRSDAHTPREALRLGNGWTFLGWNRSDRKGPSGTAFFGPKELQGKSLDEVAKAAPWRFVVNEPSQVVCSTNGDVLVASDWGALVRSQPVGEERPRWTLDLNEVFPGRERQLRDVHIQLCGDVLVIQSMENVLAVDPESGKILWKRDVTKDLGARFYGEVMGLNVATASFARDGDVLIIAYEERVLAFDMKTQKYLWTMRPDTFPQRPLPLAHKGIVYLSAGERRKVEPLPKTDRG